MISKFNVKQYQWYQRFIKLRASPHAIAGGMALGLFIGMSPFFGLHVITAVSLATLLKWSKITALIGVNITNAITAPLIYPINYWIGTKLFGSAGATEWPSNFTFTEFLKLLEQSTQIIRDLTIGGLVLGAPLALFGYGVTLRLVIVYRRRRTSQGEKTRCPLPPEASGGRSLSQRRDAQS